MNEREFDPAAGAAAELAPGLEALGHEGADAPETEVAGADADLGGLADERIVHGLLTTLIPGEREAQERDRRTRAALAQLEELEGGRSRARPASGGHGRHRALLFRVLPALAIVALALVLGRFAVQTAPSAVAEFPALLESNRRAWPRTYSVRVERDVAGAWAVREGTLSLGPAGRFVLAMGAGATAAGETTVMGFDGEEFWVVPPTGPVTVGTTQRLLEQRSELGPFVEGVVLGRLLRRLEQGYDVELHREAGGDGMLRWTATRTIERNPRRPAPAVVRLHARAADQVVELLEAEWEPPVRNVKPALRVTRLELRLVGEERHSLKHFQRHAHHAGDREVVEEEDGRRPGGG